MSYNNPYKLNKKKRSPLLPVLLSFIFIIGASYAIATVWQKVQDSGIVGDIAEQAQTNVTNPGTNVISDVPLSNSPQITGSNPSGNDIDEPPLTDSNDTDIDEPNLPSESPERSQFPYALKETGLVPASYFDDAIFFGDSISHGIPLYNVMPNAKVVAFTGIGTTNVLDKECIDVGDKRVTMLEAAKQYGEKKKVYIMLGGNGLGYEKEPFIEGYSAFIDAVKEQYPNAYIYIQSMTPVTDSAHETYPNVSNEIIEKYNLAIHDMAKSKGVYFLDVASALMDSEGKLPDEASPVDGLHFTAEYYSKWFYYLRTHAVPEKK